MFLKDPIKRQHNGFWNFDFSFSSRETVNYCLYECKHIIMKKCKN